MAFKSPPPLKAGLFGARGIDAQPAGTVNKPPPKPKGPPGARIENRIGVHAPADTIWSLIYNLEGWADWNPMYPRAEGSVGIGRQVSMTRAIGGKTEELQPTILEWVPNDQLHFRSATGGGFVKTIHFLEIEVLGPESCIVSVGELVSGLMAPAQLRAGGRDIQRALKAMNLALKERAEALWRTQQQGPISVG
jgi:hypothetical protein